MLVVANSKGLLFRKSINKYARANVSFAATGTLEPPPPLTADTGRTAPSSQRE